jgi:hypothetical protein
MGRTSSPDSSDVWTSRSHRGTGWETVTSPVDRQIVMHLKVLGLGLPVRRRIPYSQIVRLATVCRESWWSRALTPISGSFGRGVTSGAGPPERTVMPSKGWRFDITITLKGGKTVKIKTVASPEVAEAMERQVRRSLGLSPNY